jgi:hypothetical protein
MTNINSQMININTVMKCNSNSCNINQNGKGSKPRPTNIKQYGQNFDTIDWNKNKDKKRAGPKTSS